MISSLSPLHFSEPILSLHFLLTAEEWGGLGDLACGAKIAAILQRYGIPPAHITLCTQTPQRMELFREIHHCRILSLEEARAVHEVGMHIIAPVVKQERVAQYLGQQKPVLALYEYGFDPLVSQLVPEDILFVRAFGLSRLSDERGIFIEPDLVQWALSPESQDKHARAMKLRDLSPPLLTALLQGNQFPLEELLERKNVYIGYACRPETSIAFVQSLSELNAQEKKDLVFILPSGKSEEILSLLHAHYPLCAQTVSLFKNGSEGCREVRVLHPNSHETRHIQVITGSFPFQDLKRILMASEKETLATGDQSMSEMISADKCAFYECRNHKIPFMYSLERIYRRFFSCSDGNDIESIFNAMKQYFLQQRGDHFAHISQCNRELSATADCAPMLKESIETLYRKSQTLSPWPLTNLTRETRLLPSLFPPNRAILLTKAQYETAIGNSSHPVLFPDSVFSLEIFDSYYIIRRFLKT